MKKFLALIVAALFCMSSVVMAAKEAKGHHGVMGVVKAVDSEKRTISIEVRAKGEKKGKEETFVVAKDVSLTDVKIGERIELKLNKDKTLVEKIEAAAKKKK